MCVDLQEKLQNEIKLRAVSVAFKLQNSFNIVRITAFRMLRKI